MIGQIPVRRKLNRCKNRGLSIYMFIRQLFFDVVCGIISVTIHKQKKFEPFPVITCDNKMIIAHRVGWIIWIGQIVERLGIIFPKQNRLN